MRTPTPEPRVVDAAAGHRRGRHARTSASKETSVVILYRWVFKLCLGIAEKIFPYWEKADG